MNAFILDLFKNFETENIEYCHFKSNNNLEPALCGVDDLDLLVGSGDFDKFSEVLSKFRFRLATDRGTPPTPYVYHYFGTDPDTGLLVHLHVYFKIITGGSIYKNNSIRVEKMFLDEAFPGGEGGVFIPSAEADLILFVIRKYIEQPSIVEHFLFLKDWHNINNELQWLINRADRIKMSNLLKKWMPELCPDLFNDCLDKLLLKSSIRARFFLGIKVRKSFVNTVRGSLYAEYTRFFQFFLAYIKNKLKMHRKNRFLFPGGLLIAFAGSEASGKSTLSKDAAEWLAERFDVSHIHIGKPKKNWRTIPLWYLIYTYSFFKKVSKKLSRKKVVSSDSSIAINNPHPIVSWIDSIDRKYYMGKFFRKLMEGGTIITDRYPSEFLDGPRIEPVSKLTSFLSKLEKRNYELMPHPDLVIKAEAPLELTIERNAQRDFPEPEVFLRARYELAKKINFPYSKMVFVKTDQEYDNSFREVRDAIWNRT